MYSCHYRCTLYFSAFRQVFSLWNNCMENRHSVLQGADKISLEMWERFVWAKSEGIGSVWVDNLGFYNFSYALSLKVLVQWNRLRLFRWGQLGPLPHRANYMFKQVLQMPVSPGAVHYKVLYTLLVAGNFFFPSQLWKIFQRLAFWKWEIKYLQKNKFFCSGAVVTDSVLDSFIIKSKASFRI